MIQFADEAVIEVCSGKGGNGCIAFRREKYIPRGGPNGGDGGNGGSVVFCVKRNMRTLAKIRRQHTFKAKNGGDGQGWNKHGKNGADVVIAVPPGTTIRDAETGVLIHDFTADAVDDCFVFLAGGKGGWGNIHFKTATNQAPRIAYPGTPGEIRRLKLELSIIADVGLVGFPNAGKSSLLAAFTNARPQIAPYPFTTKIPHLGVLRTPDEEDVIIADIPGIIEGASAGIGLGFDFLRHISRTACLLIMIDVSDETCFSAYTTLLGELSAYSKDLLAKPRIVLCNKIDVAGAAERALHVMDAIHATDPAVSTIALSVKTQKGLKNAEKAICALVQAASDTQERDDRRRTAFLETRSVDESRAVQYPGSER
ncbi:MAG: GTPase ObgE [Treponema sp.]|nr:GTPase ObgE [Treponema sp.]